MRYECTATGSYLDYAFKVCNSSVIQKIDYNNLPSINDVKDLLANCLCGTDDSASSVLTLFTLCTRCLAAQSPTMTKLNDTWFNNACNCADPHPLEVLSGRNSTCAKVKKTAVQYRPGLNSGTSTTNSAVVAANTSVATTTSRNGTGSVVGIAAVVKNVAKNLDVARFAPDQD
ncbi:hypothetical protein HK096_007153 [Nowakowskiella sp. JEL0078]|nr:hypothetical protein HK096_007153 [Nowakowskiella sp. JEL0078]